LARGWFAGEDLEAEAWLPVARAVMTRLRKATGPRWVDGFHADADQVAHLWQEVSDPLGNLCWVGGL
jgi:hypothetical protein